jgi:hypothetical protein
MMPFTLEAMCFRPEIAPGQVTVAGVEIREGSEQARHVRRSAIVHDVQIEGRDRRPPSTAATPPTTKST